MIRRQVSLTAHARHLHQARLAARRPQVADPGQRGLHRDAAAADAQQPARRIRRARRRSRAIRSPATTTRWKIARGSRPTWTCSGSCRTCSTPATATTRRSTRSIRAAWRWASSTSRTNISMRTSQAYLNASIDTLRELAENTDGRAIVNRNDLGAGMKQIIRDSSAYYLVGYNSTQAPTDGKFHEIKVRVKRPGVQVRARARVTGPTPQTTSSAPSRGRKPGPPAGGDEGAGRDRADDQSPLHPHLDRQRQGRGRQDQGDVACGSRCRRRRA